MTQVRTILGKVGFTPKGAWDAKKKYDRLDVVSQAGASFLSLSDENTALLTDATKWMVIASKGDKGDQGYTVQLKIGTVGSGDQPSVSLTDAGVDEQGNPVKEINFVLKRGKTGYTPIIEVGTVTTVDPKNEATIELIDNGLSEEGVQKYLLNASIPRGETGLPGKGAGNVYVIGDNLEVGKKYLFVPAASGSTEGTFVEYVPPTIPEHPSFSTHSSGLYKITVNNQGHVTGVAAVTKEDITALGIPAQDTNTTYTAATTQKDGLMSKTDKQKVDDSLRLKEYVDVESLEVLPASPYNLRFVYTNNSPQAINFANIASVPEMQEFYLSILNSSGSDFDQPIPNADGWQSEESSVTLPNGKRTGVSLKKEHGKIVVRC